MRVGRLLALALVTVVASGCFRQVVNTGRTPGTTVIDRPWAPFFLWGLVAHAPIDVSSQCRTGVATVVTEQTVPNGLVHFITLGIFSPRHVTVTCAAGSTMRTGTEFYVARDASSEERARVFAQAIEESARNDQTVVVRF